MVRAWAFLLIGVASSGCFGHVAGNLQSDGAPFVPTQCQSIFRLSEVGTYLAHGRIGVELSDKQGRRLRMGSNLDGTRGVVYLTPGSVVGQNLNASCYSFEIHPGTGSIGHVQNLDGSAAFSCGDDRHGIVGTVQFENCH